MEEGLIDSFCVMCDRILSSRGSGFFGVRFQKMKRNQKGRGKQYRTRAQSI